MTGTASGFTVTQAEMTLTDDDQPTTTQIALELDPGTVAEGAGTTTITVTAKLSGDAQAASTEVKVSVTGDTATAGTDFAAVASVKLTIAAGQTTATASFTLTPVDDAVDEPDETLAVSGVTAASELPVTPATLTLGDDDERGVTVRPTELRLRPGERKSYTLRLSSEPTATAMVEVIVPPASILDLTVEPATLTFTPATWQTPQTVEVTAHADSVADASATHLELEHAVSGGDYDQLPAQPVAVSIDDNQDGAPDDNPAPDDTQPEDPPDGNTPDDDPPADVPPRPRPPPPPPPPPPGVTVADARALESAGQMEFTVRMGSRASRQVTVNYATTAGTATEGADYARTTGTLTFRAGGALARTLAVPLVNDLLDEADESFEVELSGALHATLARARATGTIEDDDPAPELRIADRSALESAGQMEFTVELSAASGRQVTVSYATATGTATEGVDYTRTVGALTFQPGALSQTLAVPMLDDALDEVHETFAVRLSSVRHATPAGGEATLTATGTIVDDDEPGVSIAADAADAAAVAEGQVASFTVTRVGVVTAPLAVTVEVTESGAYVVGELTTQVTIEADAHSAKLLIATEDDTTDEPDGAVTAALAAGAGYVLVDPVSASVTVTDDDAAPELTIADARVVESAGQMEFTVRMGSRASRQVTVNYATTAGTATEGADYARTTGTLTFRAGGGARADAGGAARERPAGRGGRELRGRAEQRAARDAGAGAGDGDDRGRRPGAGAEDRRSERAGERRADGIHGGAERGERPASDGELCDGSGDGNGRCGLHPDRGGTDVPAGGTESDAGGAHARRRIGRSARDLRGPAEQCPARDAGGG